MKREMKNKEEAETAVVEDAWFTGERKEITKWKGIELTDYNEKNKNHSSTRVDLKLYNNR